jgi:hypothetical protein
MLYDDKPVDFALQKSVQSVSKQFQNVSTELIGVAPVGWMRERRLKHGMRAKASSARTSFFL